MFISGLLLLGSDYSYFPYVVPTEELTGLELGTGRYDSIYASRSTAMPLIDPPSLIWDTDTVFCADYENQSMPATLIFLCPQSASLPSGAANTVPLTGLPYVSAILIQRRIFSLPGLTFSMPVIQTMNMLLCLFSTVQRAIITLCPYILILKAYTFLIKTECSVQLLISNAALPERIPLYVRHHFVTDIRAQYTIPRSITIPAQLKHFSADMIRHGMPSILMIRAHTGTS